MAEEGVVNQRGGATFFLAYFFGGAIFFNALFLLTFFMEVTLHVL